MTYTKTTFADGSGGGTPITAAELNKIGTGIEAAVLKAGDTMTGDIALGLHKVTATTAAGAVGSIGTVASDANGMTLLQYTPSETAADPFFMGLTQADVPPAQARADQIMMLGWNLNAGGSRVNTAAGHGAIGLSMEQYYETAPSAAQMEMHWLAVDPAGVQRRIMSVESRLYAPYDTRLFTYANQIQIGLGNDSSGTTLLAMTSSSMVFNSPDGTFRTTYNNSQLLMQSLSGGSEIAHMYLNASADYEVQARNGSLKHSNAATVLQWDNAGTQYKSLNGFAWFEPYTDGCYITCGGGSPVDVFAAKAAFVQTMVPLKINTTGAGLRHLGLTSAASDPTTTQLPNDKDYSIHKNTSSGAVFAAYNDGGSTIKKVALT